MTPDAAGVPNGLRERILDAATALLTIQGRDALTTRNVAAAAGVQAPTLYRLFGDKRGLLDALAEQGFTRYLTHKRTSDATPDPLDDLRDGWDVQVAFGLSHPALYVLMVGDPRPTDVSAAHAAGRRHLHRKIRALAQAGRLQVSEDRAALLLHAACSGLVLTLLAMPEQQRDPELSRIAREGVLATITGGAARAEGGGLTRAAITLKALLPESDTVTPGERLLLEELLDRLARPTLQRTEAPEPTGT